MSKYDSIRDFISNRDVIKKSPNIKDIENYLEFKLPKSYYNKNYWNNKKYAIGKILNEMGLKVKSVQTTVEFEKIIDKEVDKK